MMRILFMGTPEYAVVPFEALLEGGNEIIAAVTAPDKPVGRGMRMTPPPVKVCAEKHGIPVYQPPTLKNGAFADTLASLAPDIIVVVAYGRILPRYALDFPAYGCVNAHGSLLPKYRGAAPMQRALMNGETETGVCAMYMDEGVDTGDIINVVPVHIGENDDFGALHDAMAAASAKALTDAVAAIKAGTVSRVKQDDAAATYAPKIEAADCVLDFSKSARELHNIIRALSPSPLASARHRGRTLKIVSAVCDDDDSGEPCGSVVRADDKNGCFTVACGSGTLLITAVVPEGKGKRSAADFIRGRGIAVGDILS